MIRLYCLEGDVYTNASHPLRMKLYFPIMKKDGSSYPYGRSGEQIPLSARIMTIVDVFNMITSEFVDKSAKKAEVAYNILWKSSRTHFDSELVEIFIIETRRKAKMI